MMVCWSLWTPFFAAAAIAKHLVPPNIIQPNIFAFFTTVCGVQIHVYKYVGSGEGGHIERERREERIEGREERRLKRLLNSYSLTLTVTK